MKKEYNKIFYCKPFFNSNYTTIISLLSIESVIYLSLLWPFILVKEFVVLYPFLSPSLPPRFCDLMCIHVFVAHAHRSHMKKEYNKIFYCKPFFNSNYTTIISLLSIESVIYLSLLWPFILVKEFVITTNLQLFSRYV